MVQSSLDRERNLSSHFKFAVLLLRSARPLSAGVAGGLSLAAIWIRSGFSERCVLAGLAMFTVTMFGFVINDILDFEKDAAAGVQRPIATGAISSQTALVFAGFLLVGACWLSAAVGSGGSVLTLAVLALVLYTPSARRMPLLKGLYVAGLCMAPLYYASVVGQTNFSGAAYVLLALFVLGREILMDANEIAGDRQAGLRTVAEALGPSNTRRLGAAMMIASLAWLNFVAPGILGKTLAILSLASLVFVLYWPIRDEERRIAFTRLPMLAAAIALVSK